MSDSKRVKYIVCRPLAAPVIEEHDNHFTTIRKLCGGHFEGYRVTHRLHLFCHEEGRLERLPPVREWPGIGIVCGTHVISRGNTEGNAADVTEADLELVRKFSTMMHPPIAVPEPDCGFIGFSELN